MSKRASRPKSTGKEELPQLYTMIVYALSELSHEDKTSGFTIDTMLKFIHENWSLDKTKQMDRKILLKIEEGVEKGHLRAKKRRRINEVRVKLLL